MPRCAIACLVVFSLVSACAALQHPRYPPQGYFRAAELYLAERCEDYLTWVTAEVPKWRLYAHDVTRLNFWAADCHDRLGRRANAERLWRVVIRRDPDTGDGETARARLEGRAWVPPKLLSAPRLEYPLEGVLNGAERHVRATVTVAADGSVSAVRCTGAKPGGPFDRSIQATLRSARFEPALLDGKPVVGLHDVFLHFWLQ